MPSVLLTTDDVAVQLSLSRSSTSALLRSGKIRVIRIGKLVRVTQEDLDAFVQTSKLSAINDDETFRGNEVRNGSI
jgi:excisionase family DNA binding protein